MKLQSKLTQHIMVKSTHYIKKIIACTMTAVILFTCCTMAFAANGKQLALTPEQLKGMTQEQLAELSQEKSDATLNKMMQLFLNGNKAELNNYLDALGFATTYDEYAEQKQESYPEISNPGIQPLWSSDYDNDKEPDMNCHEGITGGGFFIYLGAINILFNGESFGYTLSDLTILGKESEKPDATAEAVATLYAGHFYDPESGINFRGDNVNTARENANYYYIKAVDEYRNGNRTGAMTELAYSLHYIQDAGEPHHASNLPAYPFINPESGIYNHATFEKRASKLLYQMEIDLEDIEYDLEFYNQFGNTSIKDNVHNIAVTAKGFKDMAISEEITQQNLAAVLLMYKSMMDTSAMLYKFAKVVDMI